LPWGLGPPDGSGVVGATLTDKPPFEIRPTTADVLVFCYVIGKKNHKNGHISGFRKFGTNILTRYFYNGSATSKKLHSLAKSIGQEQERPFLHSNQVGETQKNEVF